jgi:23S rRNA (adenine2503-C2)-methyltransferase
MMVCSARSGGGEKNMLTEIKKKEFTNGVVYALMTDDGYLIETTDTFLPVYTKDAIGQKQNLLHNSEIGSRAERWMIGVSTMSGCPVHCKFCATGTMKKYRNLTASEIVEQVEYVISKRKEIFCDAYEHKINYTRMGEPFLNVDAVKEAIRLIEDRYPGTHHYVSTIGISGSDFSWIKGNITLQISVHSLRNEKRNWLIPYKNKMTLEELGQIRTESNLKTTINMTLVEESDFDIEELKRLFDKDRFFIKLSPINPNAVSERNNLGLGAVEGVNIL